MGVVDGEAERKRGCGDHPWRRRRREEEKKLTKPVRKKN